MSKFDKLDRKKMKQRLNILDRGTSDRFETIPVENISPNPHQPRKHFDEMQLQELAHSIKEDGLLQPIVVKKDSKGNGYILVVGERRWRAVKLLGKVSIKAIIVNNDTMDFKVLALIENTQRANLSPMEEAISMQELMNLKGVSKKELAELISKSYDHTVSLLSLIRLNEIIQNDLKNNNVKISIQTLQALSRINDKDDVVSLYFKIKDNKLNKKESLSLISEFKQQKAVDFDNSVDNDLVINAQNNSTDNDSGIKGSKCSVFENNSMLSLNLELPISRRLEFKKVLKFLSDELNISVE